MISENGSTKLELATAPGSICGEVVSAEGTRDGIVVSSSAGEVINFCFE